MAPEAGHLLNTSLITGLHLRCSRMLTLYFLNRTDGPVGTAKARIRKKFIESRFCYFSFRHLAYKRVLINNRSPEIDIQFVPLK